MNVDAFHTLLMNEVEIRAELDNEFASTAFTNEVGDRMREAEEIDNLTVTHFRGTSHTRKRKLAIDGYDLDDPDGSVALTLSHFDESPSSTTLPAGEARRMLSALEGYLHDAVSGTFTVDREEADPAHQLAQDLRARGRNVTRYRLYLFTNSTLTGNARHLPSTELNGVPIDLHVWDLNRLHQLHYSRQGREELDIDLTEWSPGGVPALEVPGDGEFTTYLAAVPGALLADLYARHGSRLLESNVRSYLSARGAVNRSIRTTMSREPAMFLAYNNGVTATATDVKVSEHGAITAVRDLQIVNGGQTTASLFYVRRDTSPRPDLSQVHVQMKLVVVDAARARDMVPVISRSANSQNKVSEADFFSNHPFHVRMEELSRRLLVPARPGSTFQTKWFYERTRGQYQNDKAKLTTAAQTKFAVTNPRTQVITKTDAAKYEVTWDRRPHLVSAGAQKNFVAFAQAVAAAWEQSSDSFNEAYFKELVAKGLLFQVVRAAVSRAEWYQSGYLANIVTYALAKLSREIRRQAPDRTLDLLAIWNAQQVPGPVVEQALRAAQISVTVLTDPNRPVLNVTEWAKREKCWDRVEAAPMTLHDDMLELLTYADRRVEHRAAARKVQQIDSGIAVQTQVMAVPRQAWQGLQQFARANRLLTTTDSGILDVIIRTSFVSERQSRRALDLLQRAVDRGFSDPR